MTRSILFAEFRHVAASPSCTHTNAVAKTAGQKINNVGTAKVGERNFMKRLVLVLATWMALASVVIGQEVPTINLPMELRQENWSVWRGIREEGSCVHAAMVNLFRWQQEYQKADAWRQQHAGGEYADDTWNEGSNLARKFDAAGIRYAYTVEGDVKFLEWAVATRRGCGVTVMGGRHMVCLVGLDKDYAWLLDSNDIRKFIKVDRERFIAEWQNSNGWAVTPIYTPTPPLPYVRKEQ